MMMIRPSWRQPARRAASGARALGQGLLGVALIVLAALVFLPSAHAATASAITMENQTFPAQASVGGAPLQLNGVGLRAAFIYKVYLAGLYLPAKAATGAEAVSQTGPKRVQVRMLMDGPSDDTQLNILRTKNFQSSTPMQVRRGFCIAPARNVKPAQTPMFKEAWSSGISRTAWSISAAIANVDIRGIEHSSVRPARRVVLVSGRRVLNASTGACGSSSSRARGRSLLGTG